MQSLRFFVQTFGCQMNAHDSDRMAEVLEASGFVATETREDADLIVLNTCSVREKAEQKLRSEVGKLLPLKQARRDLVVAVAGCVAQQEGEALLRRVGHLDLVVGPDNLAELPELVLAQRGGAPPTARTVFDLDAPRFLSAAPLRPRQDGSRAPTPVSAFVTTMKGCDERCSFCIVPYTRGPERYRPAAEIVAEVARWVQAGAREVVLLGQTVDSFRDNALPPPASDDPDESQFPALLRLIAREVPDLARLRYTSPHPRHATPSLAAAHAELEVLARHVHLPVQSGSDRMLRRMIRRYTATEYLARAATFKAARPGLTLSTDVIVGFPGETDEDFQATLSLVRAAGFVSAFGFKYSPRPHTPALKLKDDVPEDVKAHRLAELFAVVEAQQATHLASLVGTRQRVLVEGPSKGGHVQGRTDQNEIVHLAVPPGHGQTLTGQLLEVTVVAANKHSLHGEPTTPLTFAAAPTADAAAAGAPRRLPIVAQA